MKLEKLLEENKNLKKCLAEEKMSNFFNGRYYIVFDKEDMQSKIDFFNFISMYHDTRFKGYSENKIERVRSVIWKYSLILNHHQIEWSEKEDYFKEKEYDLEKLKYEEVKPYIDSMLKYQNIMLSLIDEI